MNVEHLLSTPFAQEVLSVAAVSAKCIECGVEEMIIPLDNEPLDDAFIANYLCDECEAVSLGKRTAHVVHGVAERDRS